MQVDIKTSNIRQIRQTFSHVARRLGADKPASRYQEATFDMQSEVNFHYRPIWDTEHELYDTRRTAVKMKDWYSFKDPRQFYYGVYTMTRAKQQEAAEKQFEFAEKRGVFMNLTEKEKEHLVFAVLPLRHYEWGANMNNCFCTANGYGAAITQATMYETMDRLGLAQYISRLGLLLDGNQGDSLEAGKQHWLHTHEWQDLRRLMENLFVTKDWFEVFMAQNLVMDGLVFPLFYKHLERRLNPIAAHTYTLCTAFMQDWYAETQRWVDSTIKTAVDESPENKEILSRWFEIWYSETMRALQPLMAALFAEEAAPTFIDMKNELLARAKKIGLKTPQSADVLSNTPAGEPA